MARQSTYFAALALFSLVLTGGQSFAQTDFERSIEDGNTIIGICGCENCDGRLEHNDPYDENEDGTSNFQIVTRWTATTMSGGGLQQGDPTILTWSIIPDGTDANGAGGFVPSNMIAVWDSAFNEPNAGTADLTNRNWFSRIQQALDRWGELSGIEYVYEPNDDGVTNFGAGGFAGVRGDVRIGGFTIDGAGGILAFNSFPNVGDMAVDTSDQAFFSSAGASFRALRNIYTHEQGHGLGFAHVVSNNANFLMEPAINLAFDGPQLDDIRAIHRNYGDVNEKSNNFAGNDALGNATDLGTLTDGGSTIIGTQATTGTVVLGNDTDFVSIDDNSDTDFYKITVGEVAFLDVTLTPVGATYNQSAEGGPGATPLNSSNISNLSLTLLTATGSLLDLSTSGGVGEPEEITGQIVVPGDTIIRVQGTANSIQLYTLEVTANFLDIPSETAPTVISVDPGTVASGSVSDLAASDNQRIQILSAAPANTADAPLTATLTFFSPDNLPDTLSVDYEGFGNTPNLQQTMSIFNADTNLFEEVDTRAVTLDETSFNVDPTGDPRRFVTFPSGLALVEIIYEPTGTVTHFPWGISIDEVNLNTLQ